jgi:LmbE family N-acetylglucosaminyl deacetylase
MLNPGDIAAFEALSIGTQAPPNYFVDVTDVVELKVKVLDIMRSQQYYGKYVRKNVETWSGGLGYNVRRSYCEAKEY